VKKTHATLKLIIMTLISCLFVFTIIGGNQSNNYGHNSSKFCFFSFIHSMKMLLHQRGIEKMFHDNKQASEAGGKKKGKKKNKINMQI